MATEHHGRPVARSAVAGIHINTCSDTHTLFVVPKNGKRLRICQSSDADRVEMIDLAQELANILGVEVTFTDRYSFFGY